MEKRDHHVTSMLLGLGCVTLVLMGCGKPTSRCEGREEIWIQPASAKTCEGCSEHRFESLLTDVDTFHLSAAPEFVLDPCEVIRVELHEDALTLVLSGDAGRRLTDMRARWLMEDPNGWVALRVANRPALIGLKRSADLGPVLTLFDFESEDAMEALAHELAATPIRTGRTLLTAEDPSSAGSRARAHLDATEPDFEALERLDAERASPEAIGEVLDRLRTREGEVDAH